MVGIIIIAHGDLAHELLGAAEIIAGKQENVATIGLHPEDAIADLPGRIAAAAEPLACQDGILALVDLFGGSPGNAAMRALGEGCSFELVAGANLPMLLEVLMQRDCMPAPQLAHVAVESGQSGVRDVAAALREATAAQAACGASQASQKGD